MLLRCPDFPPCFQESLPLYSDVNDDEIRHIAGAIHVTLVSLETVGRFRPRCRSPLPASIRFTSGPFRR
jgi:hypothetical protein